MTVRPSKTGEGIPSTTPPREPVAVFCLYPESVTGYIYLLNDNFLRRKPTTSTTPFLEVSPSLYSFVYYNLRRALRQTMVILSWYLPAVSAAYSATVIIASLKALEAFQAKVA